MVNARHSAYNLSGRCKPAGGTAMLRFMNRHVAIALGLLVLALLAGSPKALFPQALAKGAEFAGPGPGVTGNDTGGIFSYTPQVEAGYPQIAPNWGARWARLPQGTRIHPRFGAPLGVVFYYRAR